MRAVSRPVLPPCTVAVFAGGHSARFGSDKALARLAGRSLLDAALDRFAGACDELVLAVDRAERYPPRTGVRTVVNVFPDCGPLGALHAALDAATCPVVACCTVDAPLIRPALLLPLRRAVAAAGAEAAIYARGDFQFPFPCAMSRAACLGPARQILEQHLRERADGLAGGRAPRLLRLLRGVRLAILAAPAPEDGAADPLFDVDTPEDLARLGRTIGRER